MEDVSQEKLQKAMRIGVRSAIVSIVLLACASIALFELPALEEKVSFRWNDISWIQFLLGWLLMCSALWALGHRWKALIQEQTEGNFLGAALCSALLLNYAIPGPFGEIAAAWFVHKRYTISIPVALTTATVARLIGLGTAALGAITLWFFAPIVVDETLHKIIFLATLGVGLGMGLILLLMFLPQRGIRWLIHKRDHKAPECHPS